MKKLRILKYENVNGFKIIRDDGRIGRKRPGSAVCKVCKKEFECDIYNLKYVKGCGCVNRCPAPDLPKSINGFEILKDLGKITGKARRAIFKCKVCFKEHEAQVCNIRYAKSCGCLEGRPIKCSFKKSHPRLFRIYKNMISRCHDKKHKSFHNYGAIGIFVCPQWKKTPDAFCEWALTSGYQDNLSIDRINNKKGYHPSNCRWVTHKEQARNTKSNSLNYRLVLKIRDDYKKGERIVDIANKYNLKYGTVSAAARNKTWEGVECQ